MGITHKRLQQFSCKIPWQNRPISSIFVRIQFTPQAIETFPLIVELLSSFTFYLHFSIFIPKNNVGIFLRGLYLILLTTGTSHDF